MLVLKSATVGPKLRLEAMKNEVQEPFEKKISKSSKKARVGRPQDGGPTPMVWFSTRFGILHLTSHIDSLVAPYMSKLEDPRLLKNYSTTSETPKPSNAPLDSKL